MRNPAPNRTVRRPLIRLGALAIQHWAFAQEQRDIRRPIVSEEITACRELLQPPSQLPQCTWEQRWACLSSSHPTPGTSAGNVQSTSAQRLMGDFTPKLAELTDTVLFGDVWARPGLSPRDRSLITVSALIAMNRPDQLRSHLVRARENGLKNEELVETITHLAFYAGWPNAVTAVSVGQAHSSCIPKPRISPWPQAKRFPSKHPAVGASVRRRNAFSRHSRRICAMTCSLPKKRAATMARNVSMPHSG